MNRRMFLATACATLAFPAMSLASSHNMVPYDDSDPISAALADGKTVVVDYAADWCSTCARQERIINELRASNPDYDANIVFIRVDWDDYKSAPVTKSRKIPRRSTLLVLKGSDELARVVAQTGESQIKDLLDTALAAATTS